MNTDHCQHCDDSCGDDRRGHDMPPQVTHTDETGVWWRVGCCPFCRLAGDS